MYDTDSRRALANLTVGLVLGYTIGFIFVVIGQQTILYYTGGLILLFSILLTLVWGLSLLTLLFDMKRAQNGIVGKVIQKYDSIISTIIGEEDPEYEEFRYDK